MHNYVAQPLLAIKKCWFDWKTKTQYQKKYCVYKNKKKLGWSIEDRPQEINTHNEVGHLYCDLVLGHKTKDDEVLLPLCKRMSGEFLIIRIPDKTSVSIIIAFQTLQRQYGEYWNDIFKSITMDNGFEVADLANLEEVSRTLV